MCLFLMMFSCNISKGNTDISIKIDSSYLILPIQESANHINLSIISSDNDSSVISRLRLAKDSVDYWIKYPVEKHKNQEIVLHFEGNPVPNFGVNKIYQSNSLDFNYFENYRPRYHFSSELGWMNDPNGMVFLDGEYHLFYQHNPYGTKWENMSWGHAVSNDLLSWTDLGDPITPDKNGYIFSGSAVIDQNNTSGFGKNAMIAIYTNNGKSQAQSIAYSNDNGRTFKMYEGNPVIKNPGIPDFRDPKVSWNEEISKWVMVLATGQTITFYSSSNLKDWEKLSEFGNGIGCHNGVWECPDLFPLEYKGKTKWILMSSINPGGPNGGSATQYFIGDFNGKEFNADELPYPLWIDYGQDNYAGVSWNNMPETDNRRISLGWMTNWKYTEFVPTENFRNGMTIPRELFLKDNGKHLIVASYPVKELTTIEKEQSQINEIIVMDTVFQPDIFEDLKGSFSIDMDIYPGKSESFEIEFSNDIRETLIFNFNLKNKNVIVDRSKSGNVRFHPLFSRTSIAPLILRNKYHIKILIDKASSELFVNKGDLTLTNTFFPKKDMVNLTFRCKVGNIIVKNLFINKIN